MEICFKEYDYYEMDGDIYRASIESARDEMPTFASDTYVPPMVHDVDIWSEGEWQGHELVTEEHLDSYVAGMTPLTTKKDIFIWAL